MEQQMTVSRICSFNGPFYRIYIRQSNTQIYIDRTEEKKKNAKSDGMGRDETRWDESKIHGRKIDACIYTYMHNTLTHSQTHAQFYFHKWLIRRKFINI